MSVNELMQFDFSKKYPGRNPQIYKLLWGIKFNSHNKEERFMIHKLSYDNSGKIVTLNDTMKANIDADNFSPYSFYVFKSKLGGSSVNWYICAVDENKLYNSLYWRIVGEKYTQQHETFKNLYDKMKTKETTAFEVLTFCTL